MKFQTVRLSKEFKVYSGGTPPTSERTLYGGDIPFIRSTEINQGEILSTEYSLTSEGLKASSAKLIPPGTLLLAIYGATAGVSAFSKISGAINQAVLALIPKNNYEPYFLRYWLELTKGSLVHAYTQGGQPNLSGEIVSSFQIPLPPLPTQRRIAAILQTWDRALQLAEQQLADLQERKRGLMQLLLTGKQRLPGFEAAGEWEEVRLGEVFAERKESDRGDLPLLSIGADGVYPQSDGTKRDISNSDKTKYKRICVGDIGYNTMRMWQGRSAFAELEGIVSPAYTILKPKPKQHARFWARVFQLKYLVHRFWRNSQGLVDDTLNCRYNDLKIVRALAPPTLAEQVAVDYFLAGLDREINGQRGFITSLRLQKKGLMQRLLTGEVEVGEESKISHTHDF